MLTAAAATLAGAYLGLMLLLYGQQSRLIHQPGVMGRELVATPAAIGAEWEDVTLRTADGVRLHGWYLPARRADRPTLLFLHGNAGNISHRLETLALFRELDVATLAIDYRGYGRSEGRPSEQGLYRDAEAAWAHLVEDRGVPPQRIVAFGRSLGGAVAAHLASRHAVGGLILQSAFTSVPDLAAEHYPIFPVRLLARFKYPTRRFLKDVDVPVLIIHSRDDEIVPFHHGRALFEAAGEPKRFLEIEGGHNTGYRDSDATFTDGLEAFLNRLP